MRRAVVALTLAVVTVAATAMPAQADNWTQIFRPNDPNRPFNIAACKFEVDSPYGPMWKVRILVDRLNSGIPGAEFWIMRNQGGGRFDRIHAGTSFSWWIGRLTMWETFASAWYDDRVYAGSVDGAGNSVLGTDFVRMADIGHC